MSRLQNLIILSFDVVVNVVIIFIVVVVVDLFTVVVPMFCVCSLEIITRISSNYMLNVGFVYRDYWFS